MSTIHKILCGTVCVLLVVVTVLASYARTLTQIDQPLTDEELFFTQWVSIIEAEGAENAYVQFKETYEDDKLSEKHFKAHQFGSMLYETIGREGIYICDSDYSYGCFHELIGQIILNEGVVSISGIDEYCDVSVGCQHGIGHGLLAYIGYEFKYLQEALSVCEKLTIHDPVDGCMGGVFMEYNMRTMLSGEGIPIRPYDQSQEIDQLCMEVSGKSRSACYFWLGQWLLALSPMHTDVAPFTWAAQKCSTITDVGNRFTCYKGVGYEMALHTKSTSEARRYCKESSPEGEIHYEVQCKGAAAAAFLITDDLRETAHEICVDLSTEAETYCTSSFKQTVDRRIDNYKYPVLPTVGIGEV